jgi:hypothetical protein
LHYVTSYRLPDFRLALDRGDRRAMKLSVSALIEAGSGTAD